MKPDTTQPYVIVNADSFADRAPRMAELQAKEMVERVLGKAGPAKQGPTLDEQYARAIAGIVEDAPHLTIIATRNVYSRAHRVGLWCKQCKRNELICEVDDSAVEDNPVYDDRWLRVVIKSGIARTAPMCLDGQCGDPLDRIVDGLTVRECLARYEAWQRADYGCGRRDGWIQYKMPMQAAALTDAQKEAARTAWSAALKAKAKQSEERERGAVVVDDDRWEP